VERRPFCGVQKGGLPVQMWVDIGALISQQVPDKNGKTLPANLTSGTFEWRDLTNKGIGALFEGKIVYDKTYGHATYGCATCCGYYGLASLNFNPLGIPLLSTSGNGVGVMDSCDSQFTDVSSYFWGNWTTGNTRIATVNTYGTHTGVAVGTTSSNTFSYLEAEGRQAPACPIKFFSPSGGDNVMPTISGPNTVWYFAGQNPSGYATSITLSSSGGSGTTWTVTAGSNKVNLSTTTGSQTTVTSSGTNFSSSVGDIGIKATAGGVDSAVFSITSRKPYYMLPETSLYVAGCPNSSQGYLSQVFYTIQDQLFDTLPGSSVPQNEYWTSNSEVVDYSGGSNWPQNNPIGGPVGPVDWSDEISAYTGTGANPVVNCSGPHTAVVHWAQQWRFGSTTPGQGQLVQADMLQKYLNDANHTNVVSPQ
jgi:hypothetical protein